jgi:hypothetical protein
MGSHYIQHGKLNIDEELLDIICPAAGYGETPPDPSIYCPAHGYYQSDDWEAPIALIDPETEQILLLCDDLEQGVLSCYMLVSAGNKKIELLRSDMTVISSAEFATTSYQLTFPTKGTGTYYIVRFTPVNAGASITAFYRTSFTGYVTGYRILAAKFYTPNITTIANCFDGCLSFKECEFCSTADSLANISYAFQYTGVEKVIFPASLPALTTMAYTFAYTFKVKKVDLSGVALTALQNLTYTFYYSNVQEIILPASLPALTNMTSFANYATSLKSVTLMSSANSLQNIGSAFNCCYSLDGTVTWPALPALTTANGVFYNCYNVKKVVFQGASNSCTTISDICRTCRMLEELTLPSSMNGLVSTSAFGYWIYQCDALKKLVLPASMSGLPAALQGWTGYFSAILEYLTTCDNYGTNNFDFFITSHQLKEFYHPAVRCSRFAIGYSNTLRAPCTSVEIDWANSSYSGTSPQITLRAELDKTELERIFTALPAVAKTITCSGCPGYATADKTIATAKGWTVN